MNIVLDPKNVYSRGLLGDGNVARERICLSGGQYEICAKVITSIPARGYYFTSIYHDCISKEMTKYPPIADGFIRGAHIFECIPESGHEEFRTINGSVGRCYVIQADLFGYVLQKSGSRVDARAMFTLIFPTDSMMGYARRVLEKSRDSQTSRPRSTLVVAASWNMTKRPTITDNLMTVHYTALITNKAQIFVPPNRITWLIKHGGY